MLQSVFSIFLVYFHFLQWNYFQVHFSNICP